MATRDIEFGVRGMTCENCSSRVEQFIRNKVAGVEAVQVDLEAGKALVRFDPDKANAGQLAKAVELAGYQAIMPSDEKGVSGTWL